MTANSPGLAALLRMHRESILVPWEAEARALPGAATLERLALSDHLPGLLERIADRVDAIDRPANEQALDHVVERFDLTQIVGELALLRDCITRTFGDRCAAHELLAAMRAIDELAGAAVAHVTRARASALHTLDQVAREQRLLARTTVALNADLDRPPTLAHLVEVVVPELADWCVLDVLREGTLERVATAHSDPTKVALVREWSTRFPPEPRRPSSIDYVLRTGSPQLVREVTDLSLLQSHASREYIDMLQALGIGSVVVVPLAARGRALGTLTLVRTTAGAFGERELATAVEIGRRAGMCLDNARLHADAQDAIYSRDRMLAIVSHEMRSPLASIELATTLARDSLTLDPRVLKHLDVVQRSAGQMERLLGDLLDTASLQVGRFRVTTRREDITRLVNEAVAAQEALARYRTIRIERDMHLAGACARVDRTRMLQALANVIGNAIKFCKAGDVIFIKGRTEGDQVHLLVEDTGPGIQPRDLPYIFEPYWSARRIAAKGTGLGLYICKGIVEAHGGTITAESKLGEGSTFTIVLPLDPEP